MMHASLQNIDGRSIHLLDSGGEGRPVLFCHGNSGSARLFAPLLEGVLSERYRCLAFDFPGHAESGASASPESDYSVPGLAAVLRGVVEALGLPRYVLVGHSLGGHVAATALPDLTGVAGLMLVSAPPVSPTSLAEAFQPDPTQGAMFSGSLTEAQVASFVLALLGPGKVSAALVQALESSIRATSPEFRPALLASIVAGRVADERRQLEASKVPTCLVYGTEDRFLQPAYFGRVSLRTPFRGGVHAFEGSGHCPHLDAAEKFRALLSHFLLEGAAW